MRRVLASVLLVSAAACARTTARPASPAPDGVAAPLVIGETFTLQSSVLHERRRINVWVPPVYADSPSVRLPVLYMPDGGMAEDFLHIAGLLQVSIGNGTMRPFILVGIENTERRRDMTGPTDVESDRKIAPRVGGSAPFRTFIRTELMPAVRARYRTTPETAVMGESLAGLFVVETLVREPDLFDTYVAFDASLWWNRERLIGEVAPLLRGKDVSGKRIFLANSGEPGLVPLTPRMVAALESVPGLRVHFEVLPAETHATIYHPAALRAVRALFPPGG